MTVLAKRLTLYRQQRIRYSGEPYVRLTLDCPRRGRSCIEVHVGESEARARSLLDCHAHPRSGPAVEIELPHDIPWHLCVNETQADAT